MTAPFNPYHTWLGLPADVAAPSHYQLLGLADFESNPQTIAQAVERATTTVRSQRPGEHAAIWAQLLDALKTIKETLNDAEKKAEYDQQLRASKPTQAPQAASRLTRPAGMTSAPSAKAAGTGSAQRMEMVVASQPGTEDAHKFPPGMFAPGSKPASQSPSKPAPAASPAPKKSAPPKPVAAASPATAPASPKAPAAAAQVPVSASHNGGNVQAIPTGAAPTGVVPMGQAPAAQVPMGKTPAAQVPMGNAPIPVGQAPAAQVPMGLAQPAPMGQAPVGQVPMGQAAVGHVPPGAVGGGHAMASAPVRQASIATATPVAETTPQIGATAGSASQAARHRRRQTLGTTIMIAVGLVVVAGVYFGIQQMQDPDPNVVTANLDDPSSVAPDEPIQPGQPGQGQLPENSDDPKQVAPPESNDPGNNPDPEQVEPKTPDKDPGKTEPEPPETEPTSPKTPTVPTPPAEPTTPPAASPQKPTAADLAQLRDALTKVRAALKSLNLSLAEEQLTLAAGAAKTPEHKAMVERATRLTGYVTEFRGALVAALKSFQSGANFMVGDKLVSVVESSADRIVVRSSGENYRYQIGELPVGLGVAIANQQLNQSSPATKVVRASYVAAHWRQRPSDLEKARSWWGEAAAEGFDLGDLPKFLDDDYDAIK